MDINQRVEKAFSCRGWFPIEDMLWAVINNDTDAMATYRLKRKKLDAKKLDLLKQIENATTDKEKEAILSQVTAPMDAKSVSVEELEREKALIEGSR